MKSSFQANRINTPFIIQKVLFTSVLVLCCATNLKADVLHLENGKSVSGEILEEIEGVQVTFRYSHKGKEITRDVPAHEIKEIEREEVEITDVEDLKPLLEKLLPSKNNPLFNGQASDEIIVIHLRGEFDIPRLSAIGEIITFSEYQLMMDVARSREPKAIVLAIDSPGGLVYTCDQIIDSLIEVQSDPYNENIVAWVELGGSAAALTALACKKIVMRPNGRMGSATAIFTNGDAVPDAMNAMENKLEAMSDARTRQISDLTGRPIEIQLAMQEPEHEFWFDGQNAFSLTKPDNSVVAKWKSFDTSREKPLALSSQELNELGVSEGTAGSTKTLLETLGFRPDTRVINIDLMDQKLQDLLQPAREKMAERFTAYASEYVRYQKRLVNFAEDWYRASESLGLLKDPFTRVQLNIVKRNVDSLRVPAITPKLKKLMEEIEPSRLALYDRGIRDAKSYIAVCRKMLLDSYNMGTVNPARVWNNLKLAGGNAVQGYFGRKYNPGGQPPAQARVEKEPEVKNVPAVGNTPNNQVITGQVQIKDEVAGPLHVVNGGQLRLMGVCKGNLVVERGGSAVILGIVGGDVTNNGGTIEIHGIVAGSLNKNGGTTNAMKGSVISGFKQ
jgi:ATP-dependent protease ClpP protease subunit